ncbi:GNAT family N-acetyltransferase [Agromyces sp. Marseille-P2726]|uniref:GNAT family N-acetyltransferase n=1 Tax=Agromyces sp. Marseille-P2726 TaxID=2709132 RepID=UPI00156E5945|nr:GNAT family N-acetyltransferase [Agromyces sp. Marseille-P2726]
MRFRQVDVADPEALALLDAYFAERSAGFPAEQGTYRPTYPTSEQFTPPAGVFLVVEDDHGTVIGCGGVRRVESGRGSDDVRFEVKHLWLAPSSRGRGAGRALLTELERRAIGFGADELVLDTNASLEAAGGLYRSSGYVEIQPYNANPNATHWFGKRVAR